MPFRFNASMFITLFALLSMCDAVGHHSKAHRNRKSSFEEKYAELSLRNLKYKAKGTAVEDAKLDGVQTFMDLSNSIVGVLDANASVGQVAVSGVDDSSNDPLAKLMTKMQIKGDDAQLDVSQSQKTQAVHLAASVANQREATRQFTWQPGHDAQLNISQAKKTQAVHLAARVARQGEATRQFTWQPHLPEVSNNKSDGIVALSPALVKVGNKKTNGSVALSTALVNKINISSGNATVNKTNASAAFNAVAASLPMASFAIKGDPLIANPNVSQVNKTLAVPVAARAAVSSKKTNGSVAPSTALVNKTNASSGNTTVNKTNSSAALDAVAESLPMASFALDDGAKSAQKQTNKTQHTFPGNASQQAAFEKKEKSLENEVHALKARLMNASESLESNKHQVLQVAAGTFNAHLRDAGTRAAKKFMVAKGPAPMQPLRKDDPPKAQWPTMASVAAPVGVSQKASAVVPPQKEAIKSQAGDRKKLVMGTAFTGTPAKKVESILAMETTVDHEAVATAEMGSEDVLASSILGWFSSFFTWLRGKPAVVAKPRAVAATAATNNKGSSFVKLKQVPEAILDEAVQEESHHIIEVSDAWVPLEQQDVVKEQTVRREDAAERERAAVREDPRQPTKSELQSRHIPEMSSFWGQLEKQDNNIQATVQSDDLVKLAQLTQEQDNRVAQESDLLDNNLLTHHNSVKHDADNRLPAIHEPWLVREKRDKLIEQQVHDSPDLQMLQLADHHVRK